MAKAKAKTDVQELSDQVLARLEAPPAAEGGPEALFGGKLGAGLRKLVPDLVKVLLKAGADGKLDASDIVGIVTDVVTRIRDKQAGAA